MMKKADVLMLFTILLFNVIFFYFIISLFISCAAVEKVVCPERKVKTYDSRDGETCEDEFCVECVDLKNVR